MCSKQYAVGRRDCWVTWDSCCCLQLVTKSSKTGRRLDSFFHPGHFYLPLTTVSVSQAQKRQLTRKTVGIGTKSSQNLCQIINRRRLQMNCYFQNVKCFVCPTYPWYRWVMSPVSLNQLLKSGSFHGQSTHHSKISREWVIHNGNVVSEAVWTKHTFSNWIFIQSMTGKTKHKVSDDDDDDFGETDSHSCRW